MKLLCKLERFSKSSSVHYHMNTFTLFDNILDNTPFDKLSSDVQKLTRVDEYETNLCQSYEYKMEQYNKAIASIKHDFLVPCTCNQTYCSKCGDRVKEEIEHAYAEAYNRNHPTYPYPVSSKDENTPTKSIYGEFRCSSCQGTGCTFMGNTCSHCDGDHNFTERRFREIGDP